VVVDVVILLGAIFFVAHHAAFDLAALLLCVFVFGLFYLVVFVIAI